MAEIKTIYKGESITMLFTFPEAYDMVRLTSHKVFVGETEFAGVKDGQTVKLQLKSSDTDRMIGNHRVVLWMQDTTLGLRKPYCGDLVVARTQAAGNTVAVSNISDIIVPIVISETAITVGDILYNYVKGDKGDDFKYEDFTPEQLEALKVKGDAFEYSDFTQEQIALLQKPASDTAVTVSNAEGLRVTAETTRAENEQGRVTAEGTRQSNEIARGNSEDDREDAEALRLSAEITRGQNEQARINAEELRVTAEGTRQTNTATAITNANNAAINANTKAGLADTAAKNANEKANLADAAATNADTKAGLANTAATNADNARLAIQGDLAGKLDKTAITTQPEAEANTENTKFMTALRVFQNFVKNTTTYVFSTLNTTSKTVLGAINELFAKSVDLESLMLRKLVEPLGATYNTTTKLYSLNGLTDITEAQMINIYNYTAVMIKASSWIEAFNNVNFRTNIQGANKGNLLISSNYSFQSNAHLEVFKMSGGVYLTSTISMFYNCPALREVDFIYMQMSTANVASNMFQNCPALVTCNLRNLKVNLSFAWSPLLGLASLQYLIQYRANGTTPITITVHPTVFAKLTDNTNYPTWYAVNQDALTKYITFASA